MTEEFKQEDIIDSYKEIIESDDFTLFKDKGSKFFAYAYVINNEDQVKDKIEILKKEHHNARHHCYAYRIGERDIKFRANDDGEPSKTAGAPILGQIVSKELTNILVVVVRYFGGTKLGVAGLINAYKTAAKEILDQCEIIEKTINNYIIVKGNYTELNDVMRFIKEKNLDISDQQMTEKFYIKLEIREKDAKNIFEKLQEMHKLEVKLI